MSINTDMDVKQQLTEYSDFIIIFLLSSLGGLAALLRSGQEISLKAVITACLNSGLLGLIIAFIWWNEYNTTNLFFLIGVSALAGLGGSTTIDFVTRFIACKLQIVLSEKNSQEEINKDNNNEPQI